MTKSDNKMCTQMDDLLLSMVLCDAESALCSAESALCGAESAYPTLTAKLDSLVIGLKKERKIGEDKNTQEPSKISLFDILNQTPGMDWKRFFEWFAQALIQNQNLEVLTKKRRQLKMLSDQNEMIEQKKEEFRSRIRTEEFENRGIPDELRRSKRQADPKLTELSRNLVFDYMLLDSNVRQQQKHMPESAVTTSNIYGYLRLNRRAKTIKALILAANRN